MVTKEFIREHKPLLIQEYRRKSKDLTTEDIEDLVQDTFEKVTLYKDYYDSEKGTLSTWLKMMCVHVYDRHMRGSLQMDEIVSDYTKDETLISSNEYYYNNNKEEVDRLINLLPKSQQGAVYFKLIMGHTHEEVAHKINVTVTASQSLFKRGLDNLKKLVNSDNPEKEVMYEPKLLKPQGDKPFAGDWAWRYGESEAQRNSGVYIYTDEEIAVYCKERNLNYNIQE